MFSLCEDNNFDQQLTILCNLKPFKKVEGRL